MQKRRLTALFLTVLIDLLGFGIVIPLLPQYAKDYGASRMMLAALMASFSAMQFLVMPIWGRLSDRRGRRPILLIGLAGSTFSYLLFGAAEIPGFAESLGFANPVPLILLSRILAGAFGATIGTSYAYIADVTDETSRGRGMALIGAAFGVGFTVGPALGGWAFEYGGKAAPGFVAAGLSFLALLYCLRSLKEPEKHHEAQARGWDALRSLGRALRQKTVPSIILLQFLATFCFANMEGVLALFARAKLHYEVPDNAWLFTYLGFCLLVAQGFVVRRFLPKFGELHFNVAGSVLLGIGFVATALASEPWHVWSALPVAVLGFAMMTTSLASLLSRRTPASMQGEVLGVGQSALSLARILGPAVGNLLLLPTLLALPFWVAASLTAVALVWSIVLARTPFEPAVASS